MDPFFESLFVWGIHRNIGDLQSFRRFIIVRMCARLNNLVTGRQNEAYQRFYDIMFIWRAAFVLRLRQFLWSGPLSLAWINLWIT